MGYCLAEVVVVLPQEVRDIILADIRAREQELFTLVFLDDLKQVAGILESGEYLPLADNNVFLEVIGCLFGDAEILHVRRHLNLQFAAKAEKMVDGIAAGENDSRIIQDLNFLFSEFFYRHRLNLNEGTEIDFNRVLLSNLEIRRGGIGRGFLSDQNALYFPHPVK